MASDTNPLEGFCARWHVLHPKPRKYELMIVVAPTVTEDGLGAVIERVTGLIEAQEGTIESINHDSPWGHRRLAYPIQNFRDAFYVLYYFHVAPRGVTELDRELRLDEAIIRHLIVKFDPLTVRESAVEDQDDSDDELDSVPAPEVTETAATEASEAETSEDEAEDADASSDDGDETADEPEAEADGDSESDSETETDDGEEEEE